MKINSILFPTDFSEYNEAALKYASALAAETGAVLHIVHVHDVGEINPAFGEASYMYASSWQEDVNRALQHLRTINPTRPNVKYDHTCLTGRPEDEIVTFADENDIDLIVMASHGRTGLQRLLMGSVAESVLRKAPCPVLVVKQPIIGNAGQAANTALVSKEGT